MAAIEFHVPCFALAYRRCDDPLEAAGATVIADFGNVGMCVYLFRERKTAEDAARALGYEIVVEVGNVEFLTLIIDAAVGRGCVRAAVDYVRTRDGVACHFHELDELMAACRSAL